MTNWDIINIVNSVLNKDLNGRAFTNIQYQGMINAASIRLFKRKLGLPEEYQRDFPVAQEGVGISQKVDNDLLPFMNMTTISSISGTFSLANLSVAYIESVSPTVQTGRGFDVVTAGEWAERRNNYITAPTAKDPIAWRNSLVSFKVLPSSISSIDVVYLKWPREAVISTTRNAVTLKPEYDVANSVELEWDDMNKVDIAYMVLRDAGMNIERRDVQAYADNIVKTSK